MSGGNERLRFGDYELDPEAGKLFRDGLPVKLQPQPLRVLNILLERPGEIVSRDQLRTRVWGDTTFVEFDQGLNYCIRQIRLALRDEASRPSYIETLPKQGYRLIASVVAPVKDTDLAACAVQPEAAQGYAAGPPPHLYKVPSSRPEGSTARMRVSWVVLAAGAVLAIGGFALFLSARVHPARIKYTQLTDFTDSALAPALSPDGRMVAFIRGDSSFLTADQIYAKVLPNGEAKRLTDDPRLKYNLAFSPDGTQIAYTVLEPPDWSTYTVSVLGGDSQLLLKNAAGLSWLDQHQLLFSQTRSGQHMGIVAGGLTNDGFRELYFPAHQRAMAHYSYASPDQKSALVVEMDERGAWAPCRLISLDGLSRSTPVGPRGACISAGWAPDGSWMYFTAAVDGLLHLWRQRSPDGQAEQITFGPTQEEGLAVDHDGRSLITSMGAQESAIWIHDAKGERSLSSEGEVVGPISFDSSGQFLYYLLRRQSSGSGPELWRTIVASGKGEPVFPGVSMRTYDISADGRQVVYATVAQGGKSQLWLAPLDRSTPAKQIGHTGEGSPHFGLHGEILFQRTEGNFNYLERMNQDGSAISKVEPYPISDIQSVSPGRKWIMAMVPRPDGSGVQPKAIPLDGGVPRVICASYCAPSWSPNGKFLYVSVEAASRTSPGRSLAIPVGAGETLPQFPPEGIRPQADAHVVPGSVSVMRATLVPGLDPSHFAYVNTTVHRNLYRIALP